jgi:hypothetical protein
MKNSGETSYEEGSTQRNSQKARRESQQKGRFIDDKVEVRNSSEGYMGTNGL